VFRCDRILTVDVEGGAFERPAGFDLAAFWQSWSTRFEESLATYAVRLHVSPEAIEDVTGYWEVQFTDRGAAPDGWIEARVIFPSADAALPQLVAWGGGVRLMEPLELRERMLTAARAILAHDDVPATEEAGA
jgi:predicted DNA-binding transcriptional regulator YafY